MDLEAASGTAATCTGKTSRRPRRVSVASTGWPRKAPAGRPPSPAPATTTTAGTRTRTRAGPGATSAATPASLRSGFARTCAVQVPALDPGGEDASPPVARHQRLHPPRTCGRTTRAPTRPTPAPSDWPELSPGRGTQSPLAAAAFGVSSSSASTCKQRWEAVCFFSERSAAPAFAV
ncbi:hypothetical protein LEMLEM_LOCUS25301 [Lemmus lemmus]